MEIILVRPRNKKPDVSHFFYPIHLICSYSKFVLIRGPTLHTERCSKIVLYPIYADQSDTYQADLMFELYINSKKEKILHAILVVINVNTNYAFAEAVDYKKNYKGMEEKAWNTNSSRILSNNNDAPLALRSFKRI